MLVYCEKSWKALLFLIVYITIWTVCRISTVVVVLYSTLGLSSFSWSSVRMDGTNWHKLIKSCKRLVFLQSFCYYSIYVENLPD